MTLRRGQCVNENLAHPSTPLGMSPEQCRKAQDDGERPSTKAQSRPELIESFDKRSGFDPERCRGIKGRSRNMIFKLLSVSSFVVIADRLTKYILLRNFSEGESFRVVPGLFHITLVLNSGAAFGLFKGRSIFFTALTTLVIVFICFYTWHGRCKDLLTLTALSLILGGAAGNLIDRVAFGYVIDFLDFRIWPVFNIADASITIGAFILAVRMIRLRAQ